MFSASNSTYEAMYPSFTSYISLEAMTGAAGGSGDFTFLWASLIQQVTLANAWKFLLVLHILVNFKVFPFIYHLRLLNAVRFVLRSQRSSVDLQPEQIFQPLITSSQACLMDIDVLGHKSNSTYFSDVDIARTHLLTTIFSKGIEKCRGSTTMNGLNGKTSNFSIALGGVSCTFRKELLPFETYDMWTRLLSWDDKWVYVVTHFVKRGSKVAPGRITLYPEQQRRHSSTAGTPLSSRRGSVGTASKGSSPERLPIAASAMSKIVFKDGRRTITPAKMLELSGLLPSEENTPKSSALDSANDNKGGIPGYGWPVTPEEIEVERQRGQAMAQLLAKQIDLECEFADDAALGRHHDGFGVEGVVSTLAQLSGLSRYQLV
ncbi:uncharacterized protein HMPREF1541_09104 [Cyphellophora europaea CBS 101466]|uniref:Thioesterase domain-containing protein n=1 Tax=Cyphellophora europaea (strain CBS 101466) TaxID=1220924 RepID=W2SB69_CYPE1|nr:uncharacterized protein HMPREF1541_09104 [Cyphellophora europaea CBS 101466]ETN45273.1 hypothetical protein HMPREF1541_09104 [Cyphellophora europaea CBS 101466]